MLIVEAFEVSVDGYGAETFIAGSASKARAAAWRAFTECRRCSFRDFLSISAVRRGTPPAGFGTPILVGGTPAYRVDARGAYVTFVRPGCDTVLSSHPRDVTTPDALPEGGCW